jgi:hypothetical protein
VCVCACVAQHVLNSEGSFFQVRIRATNSYVTSFSSGLQTVTNMFSAEPVSSLEGGKHSSNRIHLFIPSLSFFAVRSILAPITVNGNQLLQRDIAYFSCKVLPQPQPLTSIPSLFSHTHHLPQPHHPPNLFYYMYICS